MSTCDLVDSCRSIAKWRCQRHGLCLPSRGRGHPERPVGRGCRPHYGGLFDPASDSTPNDLCLSPPCQFGTPSTYASPARKPRSAIDFERDQGDARRRLDLGPRRLRQHRCDRHLFRDVGRLGDRRDYGTRASRVGVARVRHRGFRDRISLSIFGRRMDGSGRDDRPNRALPVAPAHPALNRTTYFFTEISFAAMIPSAVHIVDKANYQILSNWLTLATSPPSADPPPRYCPRFPRTANRTASSAARNSARALSTHSFCSAAGEES